MGGNYSSFHEKSVLKKKNSSSYHAGQDAYDELFLHKKLTLQLDSLT